MNKPLWQPTEDKKKNSLLMDFCKFVELNPKSFYSVWKWSVENPKIFWSKFWDFSKIIGDKGKEIINFNEVFNKTRFFQDSKLNYSENILKKKTSEIAIGFLSESGYQEKITWNELYSKVCKLSAYFN